MFIKTGNKTINMDMFDYIQVKRVHPKSSRGQVVAVRKTGLLRDYVVLAEFARSKTAFELKQELSDAWSSGMTIFDIDMWCKKNKTSTIAAKRARVFSPFY